MLTWKKENVSFLTAGALLLWALYASLFVFLKNNSQTASVAGYLALIGEAGFDLVIAFFAFIFWKFSEEKSSRMIFGFFFFAFMFAVVADGIYNIVLNLFQFQYVNPLIVSSFDVPFALFLLFQLTIWLGVFWCNQEGKSKVDKWSYLPYAVVSALIFALFMFGISWRIKYFSAVGVFQILDTVLEVLGFALATICFARSKTNLIRFTSIGYLFIVLSDLMIRYQLISGGIPYLSPLEATWVLGLLLTCLGFLFTPLEPAGRLNALVLLPVNSLRSQIAIWLLVLWLVLAFLCVGMYCIFLNNSPAHLAELKQNLFTILVPFTLLAMISSHYISTRLSSPLSHLEHLINTFINDEHTAALRSCTKDYSVFEFCTLKQFVFDAFALYKKKHQMEVEFAEVASQVAHDIRSPLAALNSLSKDLPMISADQRETILSSIDRIHDIAGGLLKHRRGLRTSHPEKTTSSMSVQLIFPVLKSIMQEKCAQFRQENLLLDLEISDPSLQNLYCSFDAAQFKIMISNLVNNAVEAVRGIENARVVVVLNQDSDQVHIQVKDNGIGIPKHVLFQLEQGMSADKKEGNGLGLKHAVRSIQLWNGTYRIETKRKRGTTFHLYFPIHSHSVRIQKDIYLFPFCTVVAVDDDSSILDQWKTKCSRYMNAFSNIELELLPSLDALEVFLQESLLHSNMLFLVDYRFFNSSTTGVEAICRHGIQSQSIVVSSEPFVSIQDELVKNQLRFIPKNELDHVTFHMLHRDADLILLDDQSMVTQMWTYQAEKSGKKIVYFHSYQQMIPYLSYFKKDVMICIDARLGNERGEEVSKQLHDQGFFNLYLTTGYDPSEFNLPWVKGVMGKEPVF